MQVLTVMEQRSVTLADAPPQIIAVIPAYNEERFIGSMVIKTLKYVDTVIVVDDGSKDETAEIAEITGALVVRHEQNLGKGAALNSGFKRAREMNPSVIVTLDGDGQHIPEEIPLVLEPILNGKADIVVGSRYLENHSEVPAARIWGHRVFNILTNSLTQVHVTDSQSGFRAFSARALAALYFSTKGFAVESEMQFLAREFSLKLVEAPVTILYRDAPKRLAVSQGVTVLHGLLQLIGQYRPLIFFGGLAVIFLAFGLAFGTRVIIVQKQMQVLAVGHALLTVLFCVLGSLSLFCGIILHSIRGLLISLLQPMKQ